MFYQFSILAPIIYPFYVRADLVLVVISGLIPSLCIILELGLSNVFGENRVYNNNLLLRKVTSQISNGPIYFCSSNVISGQISSDISNTLIAYNSNLLLQYLIALIEQDLKNCV